jgi:hypothetical protein
MTFNADLMAQLDALGPEKPKTYASKSRPGMVFAPPVEIKFAKQNGVFKWELTNAKGNKVQYTTNKLRCILIEADFSWRDFSVNPETQKWAVNCAVVSHKVPGTEEAGNGRWNIPFWDHNLILDKYAPIGMKTNPDGSQMSCADCRANELNTCRDFGTIKLVILEHVDSKTDEWTAPEVFEDGKFTRGVLVASLRMARRDLDPYRRYLLKLRTEHQMLPHQVVTELGLTAPDKNANYGVTFGEDFIDDESVAETALAAYSACKEKWEEDRQRSIEEYKRNNPLNGNKPAATKPVAAKPKPEPKAKAAPAPEPEDSASDDEDDSDIPF